MWNLNVDNQLSYNPVYLPPDVNFASTQQRTTKNTTDTHSVYVNSIEQLENGHLAVFTGSPSIITSNGILETFNHDTSNTHSMP